MKKSHIKSSENWQKVDFWPVDFETDQLQVSTFCVDYDGRVRRHRHAREDIVWYIVSGHGTVIVGDEHVEVEEGDALLIPHGTLHGALTGADQRMRILQVECVLAGKRDPEAP